MSEQQREVLSADEWPAWIKTYIDTVLAERENHHRERFSRLADSIDAHERACEAAIAATREMFAKEFEASYKAIDKAETAAEKRFEAANEWRAQSADRERTMQEDRLRLEDKFMPREVAEKQIETLQMTQQEINRRLDVQQGETAGSRLTKSALYATVGVGVALLGLIVVIANYIAAHG